jgi:threonine dehydratase
MNNNEMNADTAKSGPAKSDGRLGSSGVDESVGIREIESAAARIRGVVIETPLIRAHRVSEKVGVEVFLKCENLQVTGSFKARGASNFILSLVEKRNADTAVAGVVTASSGNHGQAVAYAAKRVGLPCIVVVPEDVISVKEDAIRGYGAEVVRCGVTSSERIAYAEQLARDKQLVFVPPYDHADIVAGQGSAGLELMQSLPQVSEVFVPVGGGGLISGVSTAVKSIAAMSSRDVRVVGVEPALAQDTYLSLLAGHAVDIGPTSTIADGLRTSHPGSFTFPIVQRNVDEIALVSEDDILMAMRVLFESKLVVEPSGATSLAAVMNRHREGYTFSGPVVCVLSGGNVSPEVFSGVLQ